MNRSPQSGIALELGAGAGFLKRLWPQLYACDILPYPDIDIVFDGRLWPFGDETVSFVAMLNTFHHVPDVDHLLTEAVAVFCPADGC